MWKAFSRSVCEVVERRVGVTAFRSDVSNRTTPDSTKRPRKPSHVQLSHYIPQLKTYCPIKQLKLSKIRETCHEQSRGRQKERNKSHAKWTDPSVSTCLGAMGWSTAMVLGWYLSHPFGRHDTFCRDFHLHSPRYFSIGRTVYAQSPIQPLGIRPVSYSSSLDETASNTNSFRSSLTSSSDDGNDVFFHQKGPFTPEEALNEVSRVFEEASRALSGDVENRLGMVCMSKGQHTQAMKHFRRASHHEHAVAAYNMGQCYELGLGTVRNLKKAAKYYKLSSDRGHPTAMFNLAVFLANGWGGLREDQSKARELLVSAARLGLKEAEDALNSIEDDSFVCTSDLGQEELNAVKNATDEFLEIIGATSTKQQVIKKSPQKHNYLSHLDWLDLSSPPASTCDDTFRNMEETSFSSGVFFENDWSTSSNNSGEPRRIRNKSGDSLLFVVDCTGSSSTGGDSLDEATNCRVSTRPT